MPELLRPGVYVEEVASPPGVPAVPVSTGAFVGIADRGPVDTATFIDSFTSYWNRFGGYRSDSYLTYAVKGFFDNGGSRCYIVRVINDDGSPAPAAADIDIEDSGGDATGYSLAAQDVGAFGDYLKYSTTKFETTLTTAISAGAATTAVLADVSGITRGDILYFDDGTDTLLAIVQSINLSTKTVTFAESVTAAAEIAADARVATASQHRATTQLTTALAAAATTTMTLDSTDDIVVGQILTISDGTTVISVVVTGINGNDVFFASTDMSPGFAAGSLVVSHEFILYIVDTGTTLQPFQFLSPSSTNRQDYVENRLYGDSNESVLVEMQESSSSTGWEMIPLPLADVALEGGLDGAAPTDADYVGTSVNLKGLHALDVVTDISFLAVSGVTSTTVQQGGVDYCTAREDVEFIADPPSTSDLPDEVRDWRLNTLNRNTSWGAMYYPWVQIADPEVDGQNLYLPPSGHVMGVWAATARNSGPHTPPANLGIVGINGIQYDVSDGEHDILNPIGVNVIRAYPGEGIRIMGARTLQSKQDGKHYINVRLLTTFVKKSLQIALRPYVMAAIDPDLWGKITNTCDSFLLGLWRAGMLYPSDNSSEAYSVKCDRENNPQDVIDAGRVNVAVGINPPYPAEFIVLRLSRVNGAIEASE